MDKNEYEVLKQGAREDLLSFWVFTNKDYDPQPYHYQISNALERVASWELKRVMIFMPPRAWKSMMTTQIFPAWLLGNQPQKKIVVSAYWQTLANNFSNLTKQIIQDEPYWQLFNIKTTTDQVSHRDTSEWWYYHAVWVWWPLTWFWFDIWIVDDPFKDREEAESIVMRQKVRDWYTSVFSTRMMNDQSAQIIINTRWHIDDLCGRLLKQAEEWWQQREVIVIPAISEQWESFRPSRFSIDYLKSKQNEIGVRDFSALYQQDPILSTWSIFKPSDFRYFLLSDFEKVWWLNKNDIKLWIFIDPAFSTSSNSDDAVVMVCWWHLVRNEMYLFDIYADTSAPSRTIDAVFNFADRWRIMWYDIEFVSVESVSINRDQSQFKQTLKNEMSIRNQYYTIYEFEPKWKKEDRIKFQLEPLIANWKCYFVKWHWDYNAFRKLEDQLTLFPSAKKDDVIDCLAQARQVFNERGKTSFSKTPPAPRYYTNKITWKLEKIG